MNMKGCMNCKYKERGVVEWPCYRCRVNSHWEPDMKTMVEEAIKLPKKYTPMQFYNDIVSHCDTDVMSTLEFYRLIERDVTYAIKHVIFNDPATIVFWKDGMKTVVKATNEAYDPEKGLAMAIVKKLYGNKGNYYNKIKKWLPKPEENTEE